MSADRRRGDVAWSGEIGDASERASLAIGETCKRA